MAYVSWRDERREVSSLVDLDALLDRIHADGVGGKPALACLELPAGDSLAIGLGREVSVLNFVSSSANPPYFSSRGDNTDEEVTVHFEFMGDWSEYPLTRTISLDAARAALRYFWDTGKLDPSIRWEEV